MSPTTAAARRAGPELVEKLLTANLTSADPMARDTAASSLASPHQGITGRTGYCSWLSVLLVVGIAGNHTARPSTAPPSPMAK
jgi:hypothetical protein